MYEQEDWDAVEAHLERYFGPCDNVFHEIMSPDIHVDIYIMKPTPERNYYVLSTFGMGAHRMIPAKGASSGLATVWPQPSQPSSLMGRRARIFSQRMGQYHSSPSWPSFQSGGRRGEFLPHDPPHL